MILLFAFLIISIASLIRLKTNKDREKSSPFECGFTPINTARIPFSLQFFLIAVIFLIFDVEITLLLPIPIIYQINPPIIISLTLILFLIILIIGLYYEWKKGALEWSL